MMKLERFYPHASIELPNRQQAVLPVFLADMDEAYVTRQGAGYVVGILARDHVAEPPPQPAGWGVLREFRSPEALDVFLMSEENRNRLAYRVDRREGERVRYTVSQPHGAYTDTERQREVAPAAVYIPGRTLQAAFTKRRAAIETTLARDVGGAVRRAMAGAQAMEALRDEANAQLAAYTPAQVAEVYGYCIVRCSAEGEVEGELATRWGIIGREAAEAALRAQLQRAVAPGVDTQVGFAQCSEANVAMLDALGVRHGRYVPDDEGVWVAIDQDSYADVQPEIDALGADIRFRLTPYRRTDVDLVAAQVDGQADDDPLARVPERREAQLAWAFLQLTQPELDKGSDRFWADRVRAINWGAERLEARATRAPSGGAAPSPGL